MASPFFSIIIPTYNSELLLNKTLDSILSQQFEDFEILIIDGLSTDGTLSIAENKKDNRIKIASEKDNSIYDAMNKGIRASRGEYLFFLGSDDTFFDNEVLLKVYDNITRYKPNILYGNVYSERFGGVYDGEFSAESLFTHNICHQSIFYYKKVFNKTGVFNVKYKSHADWDNNMKWFLNPFISKMYLDVIVANYSDGGLSSLQEDKNFKKDKAANYLKYGKTVLSQSVVRNLYVILAIDYKKRSKYFSFAKIKIKMLVLKFFGVAL